MHRGFLYYYREGLKASRKTIYRNKCFFRYILYFLAEFFGRILIFFNLHFNIANVRQGYLTRTANCISFSSSFKNVGHRVSLATYLLTLCLEGLILIAGVAVVAVLAVILGSIGYGVSKIASYENYELFILIFAAPAVPVLAIYLSVSLLIFSPTAYIMSNNEGISAGETIGACYRSMMNNGKMTLFLSYFISGLVKMLYLGAFGIGGYFLFTLYIPEEYFVLTLICYIVVALVGYLLFAPIFTLANRVLKEHMFEDIVLDSVAVMRADEKINLSVCNGKKLNAEATNKNLASLFEYTEDPYKILEMTEKKSQEPVLDNIKVKPSPKKATNADSVKQPTAEEKVIKTADEGVAVQPETESEETPQPIEKPIQPTAESTEITEPVETAPEKQSATEDNNDIQPPETPNADGIQPQTETAGEN